MKKSMRLIFVIIVTTLIMIFSGCIVKQTTDDSNTPGQFTLTVSVGTGVSGSPASGSYNYLEGSVVNFGYSLESGYTNLSVLLDGSSVASAGSIQMNSSHSLTVSADPQSASYDVRGSWSGTQTDSNGDPDPFEVTFSGTSALTGTTSGWVDDPTSIGTGTYQVTGSSIHFELWYGSTRNFQIDGTIADSNNMSGNWVWTNQSGNKFYGTWQLSR